MCTLNGIKHWTALTKNLIQNMFFCVPLEKKVRQVWNDMSVNKWYIFHFFFLQLQSLVLSIPGYTAWNLKSWSQD